MKMSFLAKLVAPILLASVTLTSPALAQPISGEGRAPISKDLETVRTRAEAEARRDLIVALLKRSIGADRVGEVNEQQIQALAAQIRSDMIVEREPRRDGQTYIVKLTADIDQS